MRNNFKVLAGLLFTFVAVIPAYAKPNSAPPTARIIDGIGVSENDFPYVARLSVDGELLCTGTLVGTKYILTAAHCFFGDNNTRAVGDTEVQARMAGVTYNSAKVYIHPTYKSRNSACVENETDAAVIELSTDVSGVTPVQLLDNPLSVGTSLILAGHGTLGDGSNGQGNSIPALGTVYVGQTILEGYGDNPPEQDGNSSYIYWTFNSGEANTASGDSGGPAFFDSGNGYYIAAITCGGDGNAEFGTLSFDTRADLIKPWVNSITGSVPANTAPSFSNVTAVAARAGQAFSYTVPVSGSAPLELSSSALPAGLSLSGKVISGTPSTIGTTAVTLSATNAFGSASTTINIVVSGYDPSINLKKALLQFDADGNHDFLDLTGTINVGAKFKPGSKKVKVQIGRFSKTFKLTSNGQSSGNGRSYFDLSGAFSGAAFRKTTVRFDLSFERVPLFTELSTLGFPDTSTAVPGQEVALPVSITLNGIESTQTVTLVFRERDLRWIIKP